MAQKPTSVPAAPFPATAQHVVGDYMWLPLKGEWRNVAGKPEESVRQEFIQHLHLELGYELAQMGQELRTQVGTNSSRADIAIWASADDKAASASPKMIVECKAESVGINVSIR